jgi:type II secretory pathway component GspD/PulD (secretin)
MYAKQGAGRKQRGSLPRASELQISPQALLERCTANAQGDSEALEILVDLLASREYLKVAMNPTVEVFDGQQAQVMSKQHVPNPTVQPGAPETVECRDLVTVTPRIDSAGHINLDLAAEICDVILDDSKTTRINKHSIDTKAVVDENKTFVCRLESAAEGQTQDNAVLCLLARPRIVPSAPSASVADQAARSEPSAPGTVTATFEGTDRREALGAVAEMTGVNIMCDPTVSGEVLGRVTLDDVSIEVALLAILGGSPYVATRTPDGYAVTKRNVQPPTSPSREVDAVAVEARLVLVDPECLEALRRGLPIQGVTAPADVNALHEIGSGLAEGRTPLLKPDRVELLLRAVGQYAGSKMLAAPKVFVLDGHSASVSLANHIQYTSGYREPNDASPEPIAQHASKEVGVRLDATPHLIEDQNNIRLQFEMEINSLLRMQKALYRGKYEYDVPTFTAVTTATEIVVADGQTALIHVGPIRPFGDILRNESDPPAPMLMLIKSTRTPVRPPDPTAPMPNNPHPGDPGMGALPSGTNLR